MISEKLSKVYSEILLGIFFLIFYTASYTKSSRISFSDYFKIFFPGIAEFALKISSPSPLGNKFHTYFKRSCTDCFRNSYQDFFQNSSINSFRNSSREVLRKFLWIPSFSLSISFITYAHFLRFFSRDFCRFISKLYA